MMCESVKLLAFQGRGFPRALLSALVLLLYAGCFKSPRVDADKMACQTDDNCLPGYTCVKQPSLAGTCKRAFDSGVGIDTDAVARADGSAVDLSPRADGVLSERIDVGAGDSPASPDAFGSSTVGDVGGSGGAGDVGAPELDAAPIEAIDAPLGGTDGSGTGGVGGGGTGGSGAGGGGTGGARDGGVGGAVTGGAVTGGAVTGGAVTGGAVTGGAVTGGAVTGGAVTGGAVTGGAVTGGAVTGGAVTGGTVTGGTVTGGTMVSTGDAGVDGSPPGCSENDTRLCSQAGIKGSCASGTQTCTNGNWGPCSIAPKSADTCVQGNDDNCNDTPNEGCACINGEKQPCGSTPSAGLCHQGEAQCVGGTWGECLGAVYPATRNCASSADNDCDGLPDNTIDTVCKCGATNTQRCGEHPQDGTGICTYGNQSCVLGPNNASSGWGECIGSMGPAARNCASTADNNCDGLADNTIDSVCKCSIGGKRPCGNHPEDGVGTCKAGEQTCVGLSGNTASDYGTCTGSIGPVAEICNGLADENCNSKIDDGCPCPSLPGPSMVRVPESYCIDSTEVTRAQYLAWLNTGPTLPTDATCSYRTTLTPSCEWPPTAGGVDRGNHPVVCVDWCMAKAYCQGVGKRLCGQIGGGPLYIYTYNDAAQGQWYNACTSHGANTYPYGNTYSASACNINKNATPAPTSAVGSMSTCQSSVSGYTGIYDMSGNAVEWEDSCGDSTPTASCRVHGGGWGSGTPFVDCAINAVNDGYWGRKNERNDLGFRCCYQ